MDNFDKEFIMEMFLDSDSTAMINRLAVVVADVVSEHSENINMFTDVMVKEYPQTLKGVRQTKCSPYNTRKRRKIYYEGTVLHYTDEEYLEKFKMRKTTVQALINFLEEFVKPGGRIVPLEKKVHVFLLLLTTDLSYSEVGALFGLHKSSVSYVFYEIASVLAEQRYSLISWPSQEGQHITRIKVNSCFKFPNCVGFIDACRFKVGPKRNSSQVDTILLQAVCDESLAFIDIHVGDIGVTRKSKVYRASPLARELKNYVDIDNHILGDCDYKLKKNLITSYSSEEVLTNEEMKFNEIHWRARSYIGHAFELLKERFKKLSHIDINKPEAVKTLLCAACVLHNFVLLHEGSPPVKDEPITCDDAVTIDPNIVKTAEEKRQFLCNYINYIDTT